MSEYTSIKSAVLLTLHERMPEIVDTFGVETISLFGSVARGEDTAESDIDFVVSFSPEYDRYMNFLSLSDFLEELFGRKVDLLTERSIHPKLKPFIVSDSIPCNPAKA